MNRWTTWAAVAAATLALAGCSDRKSGDGAQTSATQTQQSSQGQAASQQGQQGDASASLDRAQQQTEAAAEAHERAADEQKALADAQADVKDAQQELQDKKQEAREKSAAAQEATQAARQETSQATTERAQAQQRMEQQREQQSSQEKQRLDEQQAQAASPRTGGETGTSGERSVSGSVVRASASELVLRQEGGLPDLRLEVNESTPVMLDGRQASISQLREGTQVRASYEEANGEPRATRIEAQGGEGSAGTSPGSTGGATTTGTR